MEPLTHSLMQSLKNCPMYYYWRQKKSLVPIVRSRARSIGQVVHKGIETGSIYEALKLFEEFIPTTQEEQNKLDTDRVIATAMLEGYFNKYNGDPANIEKSTPEIKFEVPITNPKTGASSKTFYLAGKIDRLVKSGEWWIEEYKTASQIGKTYIDRLALDSQITTYIYGIQKQRHINVAGVIYRIIRKPSIKQTAKETLQQYQDRLINDYVTRPEFYFQEERLYRSQDDLKQFEQELWFFTQLLLKVEREGLYYKNTSRCGEYGGCMYMPLCKQDPEASILYKTEEPNPELKEEENNVTDI